MSNSSLWPVQTVGCRMLHVPYDRPVSQANDNYHKVLCLKVINHGRFRVLGKGYGDTSWSFQQIRHPPYHQPDGRAAAVRPYSCQCCPRALGIIHKMHATPLRICAPISQEGEEGVENGRESSSSLADTPAGLTLGVCEVRENPKIETERGWEGRVKGFTPLNFEASCMGPKFIHLRYSIMNWVVWLESNHPRRQIISGVQV